MGSMVRQWNFHRWHSAIDTVEPIQLSCLAQCTLGYSKSERTRLRDLILQKRSMWKLCLPQGSWLWNQFWRRCLNLALAAARPKSLHSQKQQQRFDVHHLSKALNFQRCYTYHQKLAESLCEGAGKLSERLTQS